MPKEMVCEACGLKGHLKQYCNRPEGIALRGYVSRMNLRNIGWLSTSESSRKRGRDLSRIMRAKSKGDKDVDHR